jgi:hypothetical protein
MRSENIKYSQTRNYILAFSDLFSELFVIRYDTDGTELKYEKVPVIVPYQEKWIAYQRNRWLTREDMNSDSLFEISKTLPSISIGEFKLSRNPDNQHNKFERMTNPDGDFIATPVSYNLNVTVGIYTNLFDDNFQILEQILPYFAPTYNINVNIPEKSLNESVPITLIGDPAEVLPEDLEVESKRLFVTELGFKMKINIYPSKITVGDTYVTTFEVK